MYNFIPMIELNILPDAPVRPPRPEWLKVKVPYGEGYAEVRKLVSEFKLHTVCESAHCPNMGECWGAGTATLMILGNICTRSCGFCAVITGKPTEYDLDEPRRVAEAVRLMQLKHCVITSVNRDELEDQGSYVWAQTIIEIRRENPGTTIEVLIPDFKGEWPLLRRVLEAKPDILNHNIESVPRLYKEVRPQAKYERSLELLRIAKDEGFTTKSGIMAGLGETREEVFRVMDDLRASGCDIMTIGQYLQPTKMHLPVAEFIHPDVFALFKETGLRKGFRHVESGPLVRSSYHAEKQVDREDLKA